MRFFFNSKKNKNISIENKLRELHCKELTSEHENVLRSIEQISRELLIPKPTAYYSSRVRNNAYTERGVGMSVIIISENLLNDLTESQLDLVIRHEMFHLKVGTKDTHTLNEILADAFTVLRKKNFGEMKSTVSTVIPDEPPPILAGFHECFTFHGKPNAKNKKIREEIQKKRLDDFEKDSFLRRIFVHDWQNQFWNPNNWVDAVHSENHDAHKIIYDNDVRLEFLDDLQMMCEKDTKIVTTPHTRKILEFPKGDIALHDVWHNIFRIHGVNEKQVDEVFKYIQKFENKFNLTDCANKIGESEFVTLLAVLQLIMYRKIALKWRFPCKYAFDY